MNGITDFQSLLKQRTWDKDVFLWLGSEKSLLDAMGSINRVVLDLLDLFELDKLPDDDGNTTDYLRGAIRQRLKVIPKAPSTRTVLVVKSVGLLVRYKVGLKEFYDWFVSSHTLVALLLERLPDATKWPEDIICDANRLFAYSLNRV